MLFSFVHFWNRPWFLSIRVALERIHRYIRVFYIRVTLDRIHPGYFGPDTSGFYIRVLHPDYFQRDRSPRAAFCLYFSCLLSAWIFIYLPIIPTPRLKQHGYHHIRIGYDLHPSSFILYLTSPDYSRSHYCCYFIIVFNCTYLPMVSLIVPFVR